MEETHDSIDNLEEMQRQIVGRRKPMDIPGCAINPEENWVAPAARRRVERIDSNITGTVLRTHAW